jgi:hypothetical protein
LKPGRRTPFGRRGYKELGEICFKIFVKNIDKKNNVLVKEEWNFGGDPQSMMDRRKAKW